MLLSLHWLPVEQRIEYELSLLCFKIISHQVSTYLSELLHLYTPSWQLLSSADNPVKCLEYHPSTLGPVVSTLSLTRLHLPVANSLFLSVILPLSVFCFLFLHLH